MYSNLKGELQMGIFSPVVDLAQEGPAPGDTPFIFKLKSTQALKWALLNIRLL